MNRRSDGLYNAVYETEGTFQCLFCSDRVTGMLGRMKGRRVQKNTTERNWASNGYMRLVGGVGVWFVLCPAHQGQEWFDKACARAESVVVLRRLRDVGVMQEPVDAPQA